MNVRLAFHLSPFNSAISMTRLRGMEIAIKLYAGTTLNSGLTLNRSTF